MTEKELEQLVKLLGKNFAAGMKKVQALPATDRALIMATIEQRAIQAQEKSRAEIRQLFEKAEADGTMDRIRELRKQDLVRRKTKR